MKSMKSNKKLVISRHNAVDLNIPIKNINFYCVFNNKNINGDSFSQILLLFSLGLGRSKVLVLRYGPKMNTKLFD